MRRLEINNKELIQTKIQKYFEKSTESRFIHRLHDILLFIKNEEESCDSIGKLFGNSPRSISNWINKLKEKQASDNYEIYYQDECHFKLTLSIIRAWFLKGICPEIKSSVDRFKVSVFGAMDVNGQLITYKNKTFNAETFKVFLEKLLLDAKVGYTEEEGNRKKILLVLDNARYHHAKMLQPWLEEVADLLELFFLPPYSPDLNAIEMLWKKTRRNVTHNRYFHSFDQLCLDLDAYWKIFSNPNAELQKLSAFI